MILTTLWVTLGRQINPSPDLVSHPLYPKYKNYIPVLKKCYKDAYYWHGTGRFHYEIKGNSKYDGVDFTKTYDVLESIIKSGGISPKLDPVIHVNKVYIPSVSLTKYRMYARAYAGFNQYEKSEFEYVYGTTSFWYHFYLPLQLFYGSILENIKAAKKTISDKKFTKQAQPWIHTFKHSTTYQWNALNFYKLRSDIPENYGLLIGIKKEGAHVFHFNRTVERFESRADKLIKLSDITHLEVTLAKVKAVEEKLKQYKIKIPVIPLEIGELYSSTFSLEYLSGVEK
jgi:hypothetical protein